MLGLGTALGQAGRNYRVDGIWATNFLSFDGVNDRAHLTLNESIRTQLSGTNDSTNDLQNNITVSMWIKPTWTYSASGANFIGFFALGDDSDTHENIRLYYHFETSSNQRKNNVVAEARTSNPSNLKDIDEASLGAADSITGTGAANVTSNNWDRTNIGNTNSEGFVNLVFARDTLNWKIYWNGQEITDGNSSSNTLSGTDSNNDVLELGKFTHQGLFHQFGVRDLAIFNAELNDDQIEELYNSGTFFDVRTVSTVDSLVFYCPLEADGTELVNGNDLDISGATFTSLT